MKTDYLKNMKFKPDYIVAYDENKGTYVGIPKSFDIYKPGYGKGGYSVIDGWVASKSHSNTPSKYRVIVWPSENQHYYDNDTHINIYKYLEDNINISSMEYKGKHDLFIYASKQRAILAGKEMSLYDEIDNINETYSKRVKPVVNLIHNAIENAFNDYNDRYKPVYDSLNSIVKDKINKLSDLYNDTVENNKTVKNVYNKTKETVDNVTKLAKDNLSKLMDTIKFPEVNENEYWCEKETCKIYKELEYGEVIKLIHTKQYDELSDTNKSIYRVEVRFNNGKFLNINISKEDFHNIFEILNGDGNDSAKLNSIVDILHETPAYARIEKTLKSKRQDVNKPKKDKPIQFCQFRPQDEVPSSTMFKRKFDINDKVTPKKGVFAGEVGYVYSWYKDGKKIRYMVQFNNGKQGHNMRQGYYADQLNKVII